MKAQGGRVSLRKGDIRKQEILKTAEMMFCRNGYEKTSIQDIIDVLHSSKGSFYHHFVSKEALLEGICRKRADQNYELTVKAMDGISDPVQCLDHLISGMIPFHDEKLSFLMMLLPLFRSHDGKTVRNYYSEALSEQFRDSVREQIEKASEKEKLFCTDPEYTADIILSIVNRLWISICDKIITAEDQGKETDLYELLRLTDSCRTAISRILSLPYGVIRITDIPIMRDLCKQIHQHWPTEQ